jgi:hypothetical protein
MTPRGASDTCSVISSRLVAPRHAARPPSYSRTPHLTVGSVSEHTSVVWLPRPPLDWSLLVTTHSFTLIVVSFAINPLRSAARLVSVSLLCAPPSDQLRQIQSDHHESSNSQVPSRQVPGARCGLRATQSSIRQIRLAILSTFPHRYTLVSVNTFASQIRIRSTSRDQAERQTTPTTPLGLVSKGTDPAPW